MCLISLLGMQGPYDSFPQMQWVFTSALSVTVCFALALSSQGLCPTGEMGERSLGGFLQCLPFHCPRPTHKRCIHGNHTRFCECPQGPWGPASGGAFPFYLQPQGFFILS